MIKKNYEITEHYNGEVQIKYYPASHRYQLVGEKDFLIGVTTATGMLDKSRPLIIWATRLAKEYLLEILNSKVIEIEDIETAVNLHNQKKEEAASKGSLVHEWAEQYIKGLAPDVPEDEQVRNGVLAFLKWVNEHDVKFLASEKKVYSRKHEYVGTMDCIFTLGDDNHNTIYAGDFKTSNGIYQEMAHQVSAYREADTEEHGTKYGGNMILKFGKDTADFEIKSFTNEEHEEHFRGFLALLELKKQNKVWEKNHGYYSKKS